MAASGLGLHVNDMREVIGPVVSSPADLSPSPDIDCLCKPTLIPSEKQIDHLDHSRPPNWVLVIEKEVRRETPAKRRIHSQHRPHFQASFATLCASGILADSELGDGVLITASRRPLCFCFKD